MQHKKWVTMHLDVVVQKSPSLIAKPFSCSTSVAQENIANQFTSQPIVHSQSFMLHHELFHGNCVVHARQNGIVFLKSNISSSIEHSIFVVHTIPL